MIENSPGYIEDQTGSDPESALEKYFMKLKENQLITEQKYKKFWQAFE